VVVMGQLIDMMGNTMVTFAPEQSGFELDITRLPSGLYLLKMQDADGTIITGKVTLK